MLKRIITSLFCLILIFVSLPFFGFTQFLSVPVYADTDLPSGYNPANTDYDLATSFNDYVKSRNANFNGSLSDATNIYILNLMNKGANKLNTNIEDIKNAIAKKSDTGGRVIWYLDSTVTQFYNDLFDFLLQDLDLQVGDSEVDKNIYSGEYYTDDDGNSCLVYYCSQFINTNNMNESFYNNYISMYGTAMRYDVPQLISLINGGTTSYVENIANQHITVNMTGSNNDYRFTNNNVTRNYIYCNEVASGNYVYVDGYGIPTVIKVNGVYHFGLVSKYQWYGVPPAATYTRYHLIITDLGTLTYSSGNFQVANINFISQQINNNNYEGDTYITNEGDVVNPPVDTPPGGKDPGWDVNGGQGSSGDTIINFPDFELPDLNIDWSINGLGNKFPFSIPFDIASLVSVLNAEPEAPRFEGTVNFGFTTWDYDINLEQFDSVAHACRIAELLLLVFGLILITRSIIKG